MQADYFAAGEDQSPGKAEIVIGQAAANNQIGQKRKFSSVQNGGKI